MKLTLRLIALLTLSALAPGCSKDIPKESTPPTDLQSFTEMKMLLEEFQKKKSRAPLRVEELIPFEPNYTLSYQMLLTKKIVYAWGVPLGTGKSVLAYPKNVPETGGTVLLEDGTIKDVTAEEFKTAAKAKK